MIPRRLSLLSRYARLLLCLPLLAGVLGWPPSAAAAAAATPTCTASGTSVLTFTTVSAPQSGTAGGSIGTSTSATVTFTCSGFPLADSRGGVDNSLIIQAGQPFGQVDSSLNNTNGPGVYFSTSNAGIDLLVNASGSGTGTCTDGKTVSVTINPTSSLSGVNAGPNSNQGYQVGQAVTTSTTAGACSVTFTVTYTGQLVATGKSITAGSFTTTSSNLMEFWWFIPGYNNYNNSKDLSKYLSASGMNVTTNGCSVNTDSQNLTVTLPTISSAVLTAKGATAGLTPFQLNLTCQSGTKVSITMNTANAATQTGVITPTTGTGYAGNVGVQLLYGGTAQSNAVTFGTAQSIGKTTAAGVFSIPYYAQYYVTNTPVTAGQVLGTATFTISYQ
jgi:type 1 fimbria pilin